MKKLIFALLFFISASTMQQTQANILTSHVLPGASMYAGTVTILESTLLLLLYAAILHDVDYDEDLVLDRCCDHCESFCADDFDSDRCVNCCENCKASREELWWRDQCNITDRKNATPSVIELQRRIPAVRQNMISLLIGVSLLYCGYRQYGN